MRGCLLGHMHVWSSCLVGRAAAANTSNAFVAAAGTRKDHGHLPALHTNLHTTLEQAKRHSPSSAGFFLCVCVAALVEFDDEGTNICMPFFPH